MPILIEHDGIPRDDVFWLKRKDTKRVIWRLRRLSNRRYATIAYDYPSFDRRHDGEYAAYISSTDEFIFFRATTCPFGGRDDKTS